MEAPRNGMQFQAWGRGGGEGGGEGGIWTTGIYLLLISHDHESMCLGPPAGADQLTPKTPNRAAKPQMYDDHFKPPPT